MGSFKRVLVLSMILVSCFATVAFASAFRIGDQGSEVAEIQGQLASLGYDVAETGILVLLQQRLSSLSRVPEVWMQMVW